MPDPQQNQNIDRNTISDSQVLLNQAERDALSFQNSDQNNVTINNVMVRLFSPRSQPDVDWGWAERVLKEQQLPEIRQRLRDGLIQQQQFQIGLEEQPQQVGRNPLEAVRSLEISGKNAETLDPSRLIIEAFGREDIGGKLLILGAPGAGKTTMLLSLAEQLVVGALQNPQTTIPIIFELSTWKDDKQSIRDWLVEQLYENFGGNRKRKIYEQWLDRGVLLPLLDGLDELGMVRQRKCATQINEFARHYGRLVVCCRVREYEEAGVVLDELRGAVRLKALTDGQVERYLDKVRPGMWAAIQESPQMRQLLEPLPEEEVGLLRVPLFVSIAAIVYQPEQPFGSKADLLEKYIDRQLSLKPDRKRFKHRKWAYKNPKREPNWKDTRHYLKWLATKLKQNNQTELLIEQLQPSWLDAPVQERQYRLIFGLLGGLIFGLLGGLIFGLLGGLIFGLLGGLISAADLNTIEPVEMFKLPEVHREILGNFEWQPPIFLGLLGALAGWAAFRNVVGVIGVAMLGLASGLFATFEPIDVELVEERLKLELMLGLMFGLMGGLLGLIVGLIGGLTGSLIGLVGGLIGGLSWGWINVLKQELKTRSRPNQGIWRSLLSMILTTLLIYPLCAILTILLPLLKPYAPLGVSHTLIAETIKLLSQSLTTGFFWGLFFGFVMGGGMAFVQHFCLRFVLACSHSAPWDYVSFLNYCSERRLLQRVGGRYRFLHKELLDHFAQHGEVG